MKVLFWLVRSKLNSAGTAPVYARVTVNGRRAEVATGIRCTSTDWNHPRQQIKGRDKQVAQHNARLQNISSQFYDIYYDLQRQGLPMSAHSIKRVFNTPGVSQITLLEVIDRYVSYQREIKHVRRNTWESYRGRRYNIVLFLQHTRQTNLTLAELSLRHANELYQYLLTTRQVANSYAAGIVKFIKAVLNWALGQELLSQNMFLGFRAERSAKRAIISLDSDEMARLQVLRKEGLPPRLERAAVFFLVQCYTSLAFADAMNLSAEHITLDMQQRPWITMPRQKTGKALKLPLLPQARALLTPLGYRLPRFTNPNYNYHLGQLATRAGIDKHLTSHVGRKTFGNILAASGVSLEVIADVYSHSDTRTTKAHYVNTLPEGLYEQMENIKF